MSARPERFVTPAECGTIPEEPAVHALPDPQQTPTADVTDGSWRLYARCAETDPEAFFPGKGESSRSAKRVCAGCTVRAECLEYALTYDVRFGIWGGVSERERRRMRRRRPLPISA
jgi:WhiB family redox-sensing transcriptional regulator